MMTTRRRTGVLAAIAMLGGVALGTSVALTGATWEDRGGASMTLTAVDEPPPPVTGPVTPDIGTDFEPPVWSGPNGEPFPNPRSACFTIVIFTETSGPTAWRVVLETDQPPFNNVSPFLGFQFQFYGVGQNYSFAPAADYAISGRYIMTPTQSTQYASATQSWTATACANTPPPAWQPAGTDTYLQQEPLFFTRNGTQPCVGATVVGQQPFFVGFSVIFNWKTLLDSLLAAGTITAAEHSQWLPLTHWDGTLPDDGIPPVYAAATGATGSDYLVTLQGYSEETKAVSNHAPVSIGSCAY